MAKRKRKVSLFEAMSDDKSAGLQTPDWIQPRGGSSDAGRAPTPRQADANAAPAIGRPAPAEPVVSVVNGCLRLSLNYVSCLVVCLGLIVLLVGAYKLGRNTASAGGESTQVSAGFGAADDDKTYDFNAAQAEAQARYPQSGNVLVIQGDVRTLADAQAIQRYLRAAGFTPWVCQDDDGIVVLDTREVSTMSAGELADYKKRLETLGRDTKWPLRTRYDFSSVQK